MNKNLKSIVTTIALAVALVTSTNTMAKAEGKSARELVKDAVRLKTFYDFNMAYAEVMKEKDASLQSKLLEELSAITPLIWNADVKKFNADLEEFKTTMSAATYDKMEREMSASSLQPIDKGYFLGELTGWGKDLVYTPDYVQALRFLLDFYNTKTQGDLEVVQYFINKVHNPLNKEYLQKELDTFKANNVITIADTAIPAEGTTFTSTPILNKGLTQSVNSYLGLRTVEDMSKNYTTLTYLNERAEAIASYNGVTAEDVTNEILSKQTLNNGKALYQYNGKFYALAGVFTDSIEINSNDYGILANIGMDDLYKKADGTSYYYVPSDKYAALHSIDRLYITYVGIPNEDNTGYIGYTNRITRVAILIKEVK